MRVEISPEARAEAIMNKDFTDVSPRQIMSFIEGCSHECVNHLCRQVSTDLWHVDCPLMGSDRNILRKIEESLRAS